MICILKPFPKEMSVIIIIGNSTNIIIPIVVIVIVVYDDGNSQFRSHYCTKGREGYERSAPALFYGPETMETNLFHRLKH